jgi:hypothetical protein
VVSDAVLGSAKRLNVSQTDVNRDPWMPHPAALVTTLKLNIFVLAVAVAN